MGTGDVMKLHYFQLSHLLASTAVKVQCFDLYEII